MRKRKETPRENKMEENEREWEGRARWSSSEESEKNSTSLEKLSEKSSILFVWTSASLCIFCLLDVGILFFVCLFVSCC